MLPTARPTIKQPTKQPTTNPTTSQQPCNPSSPDCTSSLFAGEPYPEIVNYCNFINITHFGSEAGILDVRCHDGGWGTPATQIQSTGTYQCPSNTPMTLARHRWSDHGDITITGIHKFLNCPLPTTSPSITRTVVAGESSGGSKLMSPEDLWLVASIALSLLGIV